jgi:hypothetical protein
MPQSLLEEWESKLRFQVQEVDLLGEIPITPDESRELGELLGNLVREQGWHRAEQELEKYPCSCAVYLVSQGIHSYAEGDFWSAIRDSTGLSISAIQTTQWGQLFESIIADLGLPSFSSLRGHRYVGPILAHGGIPDFCLPDFFEHFIHPLVTRPQYAALSAADFIEERLYQSSAQYQVDKPVTRFLEYGGKVAEDFVERCRQMATRTAEAGIVPAAEEVGLPPRVIERYREWVEGQSRSPVRRRVKYRRPVLFLDRGWGPSFELPSQQIPASESEMQVTWRVYADNTLVGEVPVEVRQEEFDLKTAAETIPLPNPASEYRVELLFAHPEEHGQPVVEETRREWSFSGLREDCPLVAFDPQSWAIVPTRGILPAHPLWLLYPPGVNLEVEPPDAASERERLPRMPWGWHDFLGTLMDLTDARQLVVRQANGAVSSFPLEKADLKDQPALGGADLCPIEDGRPPLYVGPPPLVHIPLAAHAAQLHRWRAELRNEWAAVPELQVAGSLVDLEEHILRGDGFVNLRLEDFLESAPMGNYQVTVRGPLGYTADLPFRVLPGLDIAGHDVLLLPDESQKEVEFLVETCSQVRVLPQPGTRDCRITRIEEDDERNLYEIAVDPRRANAPLRFAREMPDGEPVFVALTVPIRRLRWMVVLSPERALAPEWRITSLRLPIEALEQSYEPCVLLDLFGGAWDGLGATMRLEDADGQVLKEESAYFRDGQPYGRFDLRAFMDTIRQATAPPFSLKLNLYGMPDGRGEVSCPLLVVTRQFVVDEASVDVVWDGDTVNLSLSWKAPVRVRHRYVRLWPAWRPWEKHVEVVIPDEALEEHHCSIPAKDLAPGKYLLEFGASDPWTASQQLPERPVSDAGFIPVAIPPGAAQQRLEHLADLESQGQLSFAAMVERACIRRDIDQAKLSHADFQWCFENLDVGEMDQVLALARCVSSDRALDLPLRMKMAAARRVERVLEAYRTGQLAEDTYREYLWALPRPSLLPVDTCEVLLAIDDEMLRVQAAKRLLQRGRPAGVKAVVGWVKEGTLSDEDALDLLHTCVALTVKELEQAIPHPAAIRLMEKLGKEHPDHVPVVVVRPGYWARCAAGWGRIERIETPGGESVDQFFHTESDVRLHLFLRAQDRERAEKVVVDLSADTVVFPGADCLYTCGKCKHFSSRHMNVVLREHDLAAHEGMNPARRTEKTTTLPQFTSLEFAFLPPANPWA